MKQARTSDPPVYNQRPPQVSFTHNMRVDLFSLLIFAAAASCVTIQDGAEFSKQPFDYIIVGAGTAGLVVRRFRHTEDYEADERR